jgi:hypothetical protein
VLVGPRLAAYRLSPFFVLRREKVDRGREQGGEFVSDDPAERCGSMTMSDEAEAGWAALVQKYLDGGHQDYLIWNFAFEGSEAAVAGELQAYDLIEPFTQGTWHLTLTGLLAILEVRAISPEAKEKLDTMGIEWRAKECPPACTFDVGNEQAIFNELEARGFVELFTQGAMQLTEYGKQWLLDRAAAV